MFINTVFVNFFMLVGNQLIKRSGGKNDSIGLRKGDAPVLLLGRAFRITLRIFFQMIIGLIGIALIGVGSLIYPLVKAEITKKRIYLADLGAVELTKDSAALISALKKIDHYSSVPHVISTLSVFFIDNIDASIQEITHPWHKPFVKKPSSFLDTHPTIDERIHALGKY